MPGGDVDAERDAETPGPGDAVVIAEPPGIGAAHDLGDHADTEQDQDHRAGELGTDFQQQSRRPHDGGRRSSTLVAVPDVNVLARGCLPVIISPRECSELSGSVFRQSNTSPDLGRWN